MALDSGEEGGEDEMEDEDMGPGKVGGPAEALQGP